MGIKKIGHGTHLIIYSLVLLAILAVINYIFIDKFYRIDLTENKVYSVSKATKDILKKLDDVVNIHAYFSKELPPQLVELKSQVKDILDEYSAYAGAHLNVEFIDPEDDPELSQRMQFIGIPKVQVNIFQKDKAEVANVYLGISIMFEDRNEGIPFLQNVKNLEYDLTSAIVKVTKKDTEVIGFVSWEKEEIPPYEDPFSSIQMELQKQYDVKNISLSAGKQILNDVDTLVSIAPEGVTDEEKILLDQFLSEGGKEIYLVDMVRLKKGKQLETENVNTNITDLLAQYGFKLAYDLVLDRSSSMAAFSGGFFHFQLPYPFWPKIVKDGFDQSNPVVSKLDTITLPWTSSVRIQEDTIEKKGLKATVLAQTTPHAWTEKGRFNLSPQQRFDIGEKTGERIPVIAMVSGQFEGLYSKEKKDEKIDPNQKVDEVSLKEPKGKETHVVVIGNSRFINNDFIRRFPGNGAFFLNLIDWMTMGESLIGIRTKERTERPLPEMSDKKKAFIRYINIFGISILLILFGLIKFLFKKRKRYILYES